MTNFKSGSGNLDFGGSDKDEEKDPETTAETAQTQDKGDKDAATKTSEQPTSASPDTVSSDRENASGRSASDQVSAGESTTANSSGAEYPYFVRRSNVGDDRDTRLEIHVRDKVPDQEARFRSELAEQLGTNEISKTDAREFALLMAFQHPDRVAQLMRDEGYGALD